MGNQGLVRVGPMGVTSRCGIGMDTSSGSSSFSSVSEEYCKKSCFSFSPSSNKAYLIFCLGGFPLCFLLEAEDLAEASESEEERLSDASTPDPPSLVLSRVTVSAWVRKNDEEFIGLFELLVRSNGSSRMATFLEASLSNRASRSRSSADVFSLSTGSLGSNKSCSGGLGRLAAVLRFCGLLGVDRRGLYLQYSLKERVYLEEFND